VNNGSWEEEEVEDQISGHCLGGKRCCALPYGEWANASSFACRLKEIRLLKATGR
jgi:hypothetical protein